MLTGLQRDVLRAISETRSPDSYIAGAAALNVERARKSDDIDIFNEGAARADTAFASDVAALRAVGFDVIVKRSAKGFHRADAVRGTERVAIDWAHDSAYRFFPAIRDPLFGWRLHEIDLATNKCLALAGRIEPRDVWDVVDLIERGHDLGGLVWAAPAKDPGYTAELLLDHMTWHSRVDPERLRDELNLPEPPDPVALKIRFMDAVKAARESFSRADLKRMGELPLSPVGQKVLAPDDKSAVWHAGALRGVWPDVWPLPPGTP
jgi:hypothetical protein